MTEKNRNDRVFMFKNVVITGLGVISPIGIGREEFAHSLKEGKSGIKEIDLTMDSCVDNLLPIRIAGQLNGNFQNKNPHQDRFIAFAKAAAEEALLDAQAENFVRNNQRAGVIVSSSKGGMETFAKVAKKFIENGPISIPQNFLENFLPEMASYNIAKEFKMFGPIYNIPSACSTGLTSIIYAYNLIKNNQLDLVIAGATDASITLPLINFYHQMGILAKEKISPFDKNRDGFIIGEGSGVLILEEKEHAVKRGAKIYAEILEAQTSNDNFHPTEPNFKEKKLAKLLKKLLDQIQISAKEINYINAHGTATRKGDLYETENIKEAFADTAYSIPISSTKSMHGHMLGASGAVDLIGTILAMKGGFIPPTINYREPDPLCDLDYVPNKSREREINLALKISMGFGGHLVAILLKN
jgi:3-oxoacyl-[acyl-carrier-protein] synthase II